MDHTWAGLPLALVRNDDAVSLDSPAVVLGGPGTGKTALLIDIAVQFIVDGGRAEDVMFIAPSREAAAQIREQIFHRVAQLEGYATTGSIVRSVHSWAFAVLRSIRLAAGGTAPRLITGAEHDIQIRALLGGMVEDGHVDAWPENIRPALGMVGFARQLRDLLLRAAERGVGSAELKDLAQEFTRPMWDGAGRFLAEYEQVQRLAENENLNASELLHSVLAALGTPEGEKVQEGLRDSLKLILVDDAHNLDPAAAEFVKAFARPGARTVVAGDPDQCVFHFRGANEAFLNGLARTSETVVTLSQSHRVGEHVATAVNALRNHLPAQTSRVELRGKDSGGLELLTCSSETSQRLNVTNTVRRAHAERSVEWKDIAVIVREVGSIPALRRSLMSYGVPVKIDSTSQVLAEQPLVAMLLLAMESATRVLTAGEARRLVESAVGGADPVMARRVQRGVNKAMRAHRHTDVDAWTHLAHLLREPQAERNQWMLEGLGPREYTVLERVIKVVQAGLSAAEAGDSVEMTLWRIWQATELSTHLQWRALRGGTAGAQADDDLDAVMNLFDLAGDFVERNPQASIDTFVGEVRAQELPSAGRDRRGSAGNAVEILPAHAAAGRQWQEVVISGVQEDTWPAGPTVGGLFGQQELVDYKDHGYSPLEPKSRIAAAVQEERRLFLLALTRSTGKTTVTTVKSSGDEAMVPSRFLVEIGLLQQAQIDSNAPVKANNGGSSGDIPRILALEPLIAELRDTVTDEHRDAAERVAAARNLSKLAAAGVYGADPHQWWGTAEPSSAERITKNGDIRLSPSQLESLTGCPLQAFLRRHGSVLERTMHMNIGIAVHAIAEHIVQGMSLEDAQVAMQAILPAIIQGPSWQKDTLAKEWVDGIDRLHAWITKTMASNSNFVTEQTLVAVVGKTADGHSITLSGRADLIETKEDGTSVVYDFKTGSNAPSEVKAEESPQLTAYQFILAQNQDAKPGGAALVYPFKEAKAATVRNQAELTEERAEAFRAELLQLADKASGPRFAATVGEACNNCEFKTVCPAQPEGKTVV